MKTDYSKYLSYILRHKPDAIGLRLDKNGWIDVDELINALIKAGKNFNKHLLFDIVETSDKKRFTLSEDKQKIRAAQGHSINVDLNIPAVVPPDILYHGTAIENISSIKHQGLQPKNRNKVHLSNNVETALKVGQRHGKPIIIKIDTHAMSKDGIPFWQADNGVWLVDYIAPKYLVFLD